MSPAALLLCKCLRGQSAGRGLIRVVACCDFAVSQRIAVHYKSTRKSEYEKDEEYIVTIWLLKCNFILCWLGGMPCKNCRKTILSIKSHFESADLESVTVETLS